MLTTLREGCGTILLAQRARRMDDQQEDEKYHLLEFKRTSDAWETYYTDMEKPADTKRTPFLTGLNDLARDRC